MSIRDFFDFIGLWFKRIFNIFSMGMCVFFSIAFFADSYEKTVPLVLLIILFILLSLFNAFYYFIRSTQVYATVILSMSVHFILSIVITYLGSEGHVLAIMFSAMSLVICGIGSKLLDKIGNFLDGKTIGKK